LNRKAPDADNSSQKQSQRGVVVHAHLWNKSGQTRLNSGDRNDFTTIYNTLYPFTFFYARKFVGSDDASDVVTSVFCKLWTIKKEFNDMEHARAFLHIAVKNACFTHLRNNATRLRNETGYQYELPSEEKPLFQEIGAEKLNRIYAEIEKLPRRCRQVFKLAYLDNLKNEEIANLVGTSISTVKNQKTYALKILRLALFGEIDPEKITESTPLRKESSQRPRVKKKKITGLAPEGP
jgi:RNA polymerase sigma-70 factor (ECF subfamily)